jgi:hypothetical protein
MCLVFDLGSVYLDDKVFIEKYLQGIIFAHFLAFIARNFFKKIFLFNYINLLKCNFLLKDKI